MSEDVFKFEREFLKSIGMDESFIAVGRQRIYPLKMLSDFKQSLIDKNIHVETNPFVNILKKRIEDLEIEVQNYRDIIALPSETETKSESTPVPARERNLLDADPSIPDHKGERVITWDYLEKRSEPRHHLHFEWRCPYCNTMNEHDTTIPHGLAEVVCQDKECESFMYLEKLIES